MSGWLKLRGFHSKCETSSNSGSSRSLLLVVNSAKTSGWHQQTWKKGPSCLGCPTCTWGQGVLCGCQKTFTKLCHVMNWKWSITMKPNSHRLSIVCRLLTSQSGAHQLKVGFGKNAQQDMSTIKLCWLQTDLANYGAPKMATYSGFTH